jgi:hypothetical protein
MDEDKIALTGKADIRPKDAARNVAIISLAGISAFAGAVWIAKETFEHALCLGLVVAIAATTLYVWDWFVKRASSCEGIIAVTVTMPSLVIFALYAIFHFVWVGG